MARFLSEGYFEKHINRMRNHYRALRDKLLLALRQSPLAGRVKISEEHAGLHFLLELDTQRSDEEILQAAQAQDLRISFVSQYYVAAPEPPSSCAGDELFRRRRRRWRRRFPAVPGGAGDENSPSALASAVR